MVFKIFSNVAQSVINSKIGHVSAVILCAGNSTRFAGGDKSKQMALVSGKSVVVRSIEAFENCKLVKDIILVVRKDDISKYKELIIENGFKKIKCIVTGGSSRQSSALRGFRHISEKSKYVAIHDGARCLVTEQIIEKVLKEAAQHNAATAACRISDTVKKSDSNGFISDTLDRNMVWQVQTPQVFETNLYRTCAYNAKQKGIEATDDCMLAEILGFKVKLVDTGRDNIKITVAEDIRLAEFILNEKEEEQY